MGQVVFCPTNCNIQTKKEKKKKETSRRTAMDRFQRDNSGNRE